MTNPIEQSNREVAQESGISQRKKKPYQAPAWEVEEVFEKTALGCFKATAGACGGGPIQS